MRTKYVCVVVMLVLTQLSMQTLLPLSKNTWRERLQDHGPVHLLEIEEVTWFKKLKPTCSSKNPDLDKQYDEIKVSISKASNDADKQKANAKLIKFLRTCTYESCPGTLDDLEELMTNPRNKMSSRIRDYHELVCRPFLGNSPDYVNSICTDYPKAISELEDGIEYWSTQNKPEMVAFLNRTMNQFKYADCRPASVVFPQPCYSHEVAETLLNRIREPKLSEEEAQVLLDRLVMIFNQKVVDFTSRACFLMNKALPALKISSEVFTGEMFDELNRSRDLLRFYCKVWPKLAN